MFEFNHKSFAAPVMKTLKNVLQNTGLGKVALLISPFVCALGKQGGDVERHRLTMRRPDFQVFCPLSS